MITGPRSQPVTGPRNSRQWITPGFAERPTALRRMDSVATAGKYPAELKERAVETVRELEKELGPGRGAIARVAS